MPLKLFLYQKKYDHVAGVQKSFRIKIDNIQFWYSGSRFGEITFPGEIRGGDWSDRMTLRKK